MPALSSYLLPWLSVLASHTVSKQNSCLGSRGLGQWDKGIGDYAHVVFVGTGMGVAVTLSMACELGGQTCYHGQKILLGSQQP